jgi:hypothetical protein
MLALYARLGSVAREPLSTMQGAPLAVQIPGYTVRPATEHDLDACNRRVSGKSTDLTVDTDGTVFSASDASGRAGHPLMSPDEASSGNGLFLFFRVDDSREGPEERTRARRPVRRGAPREPEHSKRGSSHSTIRTGILRHDQCASAVRARGNEPR